ncbi:MAG: P63C domain-containing protein [Terriglobia bacterium]
MTEKLTSEAARELSKLGAEKGGKARANVLTPEERSDIARNAVRARWDKVKGLKAEGEQVSESPDQSSKPLQRKDESDGLPIALFPGKLLIGDAQFSVYVLDNGKRVMAQREVVRVLTGHVKGDLGRYLESQSLRPYINQDEITRQTIQFKIPGTQYKGIGYEATLLLDICDAYLRAREADALAPNQKDIAKQSEIITRACAKVGIIALIDEATGYGAFKRKQEYQLKLQAFIAEDLQEWARMFPHEFWFELARLEGVHYSPRNRPLRWGKYVMAFVYDAVDKDIGKKLREINPDPHFKRNHHQWLKEFGRQKVNDQLQRVIAVMKLCDDMEDFKRKFARVFQKSPLQTEFTWGEGAA